jgi:hypothetical protein
MVTTLYLFSEQADGSACRPEDVPLWNTCGHPSINSMLERIYDWADANDVCLGI